MTPRSHASSAVGPLPRAARQIRVRNSALCVEIKIVKYEDQLKSSSISDDSFHNDSRF
jgi:hypothetical protein